MLIIGTHSLASTIELRTASQDVTPKYFKKDSQIQGYGVDIIKAIEKLDPDLKFTGYAEQFTPNARIEKQLQEGKLDVFFGLIKTPDREKIFNYLDIPMYSTYTRLVVRADDPITNVKSLDELKKLKGENIVLTSHGMVHASYLKSLGGLNVDDGAESVGKCLEKLVVGRGRFVYQTEMSIYQSIKDLGLKNKVRILPKKFREEAQYPVYSKQLEPKTVLKLKQAVQKLKKSGELDRLYYKYSR